MGVKHSVLLNQKHRWKMELIKKDSKDSSLDLTKLQIRLKIRL